MSLPGAQRPPARKAGPELLVLGRWEQFMGWFLGHTGRWPKSVRFTLCQRVQNLGLDVLELLTTARYGPRQRAEALESANLKLEQMRLLCRLARKSGAMSTRGFETAMRGIDETGRMIHGWRRGRS